MKTTEAIIAMGILSALFGCNKEDSRFVTEAAFTKNLEKQVNMIPQTLAQLRQHNVTEEKELSLQFFFYSKESGRASALAEILKGLSSSVDHGPSASDPKVFVVDGWSEKMAMQESVVVSWVKQMVTLGYEHDCEFDGWGTNPEQE